MRAVHVKRVLAFVFLSLGSWTLVLPGSVEALALRPQYYVGGDAVRLALACFGAQAVLVGVLVLASRFTPRTFLAFGLAASVPFLVFDGYFYFVRPMLSAWVLADVFGNAVILSCGLLGWRLSSREGESARSG